MADQVIIDLRPESKPPKPKNANRPPLLPHLAVADQHQALLVRLQVLLQPARRRGVSAHLPQAMLPYTLMQTWSSECGQGTVQEWAAQDARVGRAPHAGLQILHAHKNRSVHMMYRLPYPYNLSHSAHSEIGISSVHLAKLTGDCITEHLRHSDSQRKCRSIMAAPQAPATTR